MANELNIYNLSRNWFNWCFENPDLISPNHTALYFFCIEHCNRLGWKQKFGLPTTMAKEAIGIRSYNTYINTLNDLVSFGFIKLIEKSKNQYSSNIIALSNFNKALDKALDKATIKHATKRCESTSESICSIDIQDNNSTNLQNNNNWKKDYNVYLSELKIAYQKIVEDESFVIEKQKFYPNVNIPLSLEKSYVNFWATEAGWKNKIKSKTVNIDWKATFVNSLDNKMNHVYKQFSGGKSADTTKYYSEVDDVTARF